MCTARPGHAHVRALHCTPCRTRHSWPPWLALFATCWPRRGADTGVSRSDAARAHPSRAGAARQGLDPEALRHRAAGADDARGHRHVDHRVARVQRRSGVPLDGAAHDLLVAAPHHPRVLQSRRRQAGGALLDRPLRLREALHDGADAERRPVGGAAQAGRREGPEGDRHQRVGVLEPRRRPHRQREAAADCRRWARSTPRA